MYFTFLISFTLLWDRKVFMASLCCRDNDFFKGTFISDVRRGVADPAYIDEKSF